PLFKESFLKKHPEIKKPLNKLENKISDEDMQMMNYKVTVKNEDTYTVAKDYLKTKGLIK
ncbi:glycine betaine ABC transporter substrate-binding protein, partial [Streptococcus pyogenes]